MKAEDRAAKKALEKFPILFGERMGYDKTNLQQEKRNAYEKGYHQAEKDLGLSWEDIREIACLIDTIRAEVDDGYLLTLSIPKRIENEHREYKEILKRFKDFKETKGGINYDNRKIKGTIKGFA